MPDTDATVHHVSQGGMAATHPTTEDSRNSPVAPVYTNELNTLRMNLFARACWKLKDMHFAFDSSFVLPTAQDEIPHLQDLINAFAVTDNGVTQNPPLSVFGHADPTGSDVYNKTLSHHRAEAIYAALTRRTDLWENLYSNPPPASGDNWDRVDCISIMLSKLLIPYGGPTGDKSTDVQMFQQHNSLAVDGIAGVQTRKVMFKAYMDYLCGADFVVSAQDFLAQGADSTGKGDYQGCSRFNPLLLFSTDHLAYLDQAENHTQRDEENESNRRVMIFLFDPGRKVESTKWPCPTAAEGVAGCYARFWADGDQRRQNGPVARKYKKTHDTFACRFYDRLSQSSPCEHTELWVVRLVHDGSEAIDKRKRIANEPYILAGVGGDTQEIRGTTDSDGVLRAIVRSDPAMMLLKIAGMNITLVGSSLQELQSGADAVRQRLSNLGFGRKITNVAEAESAQDQARSDTSEPADATASPNTDDFAEALSQFALLYNLPSSDPTDAHLQNKVRECHGS